jgi:hypothetical protein
MGRRALQVMVLPFPKGAIQPWALTNQSFGRFCGVPPRRYVSCQGSNHCLRGMDAKHHKNADPSNQACRNTYMSCRFW